MMVVTDQDRDKVKQYLKEAVKAQHRVLEEQMSIKDILATLKSDHDIPQKVSKKVMSAMLKGNAPELKEENEMLEDLLEIAL